MTTQGIDPSRIQDLAERKNAERLYIAMLEAERRRDDAVEAALAKDAAFLKASAEYDAACDAYWSDEGPAVLTNDNDEIERCALSGVPLLADDELLEDPETGEMVIRSLLLPPRPEQPDDDEGETS